MAKTLTEWAHIVHLNAQRKGFHPKGERIENFLQKQLNNIHGEISELNEAYRRGELLAPCDKATSPQLTCLEEELADIIIRTLDVSKRMKVDIERAVEAKHAYNLTRPYRHGNKKT